MEAVDRAVFNADTGADGTDADIAGLKTLAGTEKTLTQANKIKADETFKAFLELVDGRHASTIGELRVVSSVGSNVLWGGTIHNSAASNETIAQFLARSGVSWRTRDGHRRQHGKRRLRRLHRSAAGHPGCGSRGRLEFRRVDQRPLYFGGEGRSQPDPGVSVGLRGPESIQLRAAEVRDLIPPLGLTWDS